MNLSVWWSAWKYVAILGLLLIVSVGLNLRQWADHRGYVRAQAAELKAAAAQAGLKVAAVIATQKAKDDPKLQQSVNRIEARVNKLASQKRPPAVRAGTSPAAAASLSLLPATISAESMPDTRPFP